jgi:hypothetical protein
MGAALFIIPLTIIPLIVANIGGWLRGVGAWDGTIFTVNMVSGQPWSFTAHDLVILIGIVCLFGEVLKSTNTTSRAIANHVLSTLVFIAYLVEFLIVPFAADSVFFILMMLALFDVVAGFTISIKAARRDLALGHSGEGP